MTPIHAANANDFIEQQLDARIDSLEQKLNSDVLTYSGGLLFGADDVIRDGVSGRWRAGSGRNKLSVILTTGGGYVEVVDRIVATIRKHYDVVDFIIPNYAYSAGTVLAMSGDAIWMDYYSRLGPIDPQVETSDGRTVPALGYLAQYNRLISKAKNGSITAAEVQLLIDGFDQAELFQYKEARKLSIKLLEDWLTNYKFKNWLQTKTRKLAVTQAMRRQRAVEIAKELNKTQRWHAHGYGISMDVLVRELNLVIDDFGSDTDLNDKIRGYYGLFDDYMTKRGNNGVLHIKGEYRPFM